MILNSCLADLLDPPFAYRPGRRYHSIDSGVNRLPCYHELISWLHRAVETAADFNIAGAEQAVMLLEKFDTYKDDTWTQDKQHVYWMQRYVKIGKDIAKKDTPTSMVVRACDAYAERPVFGTPLEPLVPDELLPRTSARTALVDAAQIELSERNGFGWLSYTNLGVLMDRTARGLVGLNLPAGATVAIAGVRFPRG